MAVCGRCRAEVPPGAFTYEGDDGEPLCPRCFQQSGGGEAAAPRGSALPRGLVVAFRLCAAAGLAGGAAIARLAGEGERAAAAAALALGAGVFLCCLAAAELLRLGLSVEASLRRLSEAVSRVEGALDEGRHAGGRDA